jgi:hypothetical protein
MPFVAQLFAPNSLLFGKNHRYLGECSKGQNLKEAV